MWRVGDRMATACFRSTKEASFFLDGSDSAVDVTGQSLVEVVMMANCCNHSPQLAMAVWVREGRGEGHRRQVQRRRAKVNAAIAIEHIISIARSCERRSNDGSGEVRGSQADSIHVTQETSFNSAMGIVDEQLSLR